MRVNSEIALAYHKASFVSHQKKAVKETQTVNMQRLFSLMTQLEQINTGVKAHICSAMIDASNHLSK